VGGDAGREGGSSSDGELGDVGTLLLGWCCEGSSDGAGWMEAVGAGVKSHGRGTSAAGMSLKSDKQSQRAL
jgi:hypothetical protein